MRHGRSGLQRQVFATALTALVAFAVLSGLHIGQRRTRDAEATLLAGFRTARLDVATGFAGYLGGRFDDSPFDRAQARALLEQGLDELESGDLPSSPEHGELDETIHEVRRVLRELDVAPGSPELSVALRVAVGHLEATAGRIDANAEVTAQRTSARQDTIFLSTLCASCLLLGLALVLLHRSSTHVLMAETARDEANAEREASRERELESAELLRAVVDGVTDAIFAKDADGRYRMVNAAAARIVGRSVEELLGQHDRDLWDEKSARAILEHDKLVADSRAPSTREETLTVGGERHVFLSTKAPRLDGTGKVIGLIGISRDITQRLRLEEKIREAQKMEAIGRLAGGVAHDFNNILTVIDGNAELLLDEPGSEALVRELVGEIADGGRRASALTAQLLAYSRKAVIAPRALDLNEAVRGSERLLRRLLGEDITFKVSLAAKPLVVTIDPSLLDQVVMNLGANARDAMPFGGTLEIATAAVSIEDGPRAGVWAELCVSDTGEGVSAETLPHIFEPFFTTKGIGKGTGLGLSMIDGIVAQAGGFIEVESQPGKGTTFLVRLPPAPVEKPESDAMKARARPAGGNEVILLVEDDEGVRGLAKRVLSRHGYRVLAAANGDEAEEIARSHAGAIDMLLTDVVLPSLSGREVADRLRSQRPSIRVMFMSGYTDDSVLLHGVAIGRDPLLNKPFTAAALVEKVREVLGETR
ncbi:MAG: PAS domain-containing protein [Myxococcales bacterium]|nr:PAS domain-containing protein [Myxococcales bacterium]